MPRLIDAQREREEIFDAFVIVMGLSVFPLISASVGLVLLQLGYIQVANFNRDALTVKDMGTGVYIVIWFGLAGFLIPTFYSLYVVWRNLIRSAKEKANQQQVAEMQVLPPQASANNGKPQS